MELDDLIETAASNHPLAAADVEIVARQVGVPVPDVLDLFARTVAVRYLHGEYSFGLADGAMNQLFHLAHVTMELGLSEFAWQVFGAFDEGEYSHEGEPPEEQGEIRTRRLLARISSLSDA